MKRIFVLVIVIITIISILNIPVEAYDASLNPVVLSDGSKVFYFDNGSSLTINLCKQQ